jgi:hypothetical protein
MIFENNMIIIALCIYLFIGIALNFIGPVAKIIRKEILDLKDPSRVYIFYDKHIVSKRKILAFEVVIRLLIILFFPIAYLVALIDYYSELKKKKAYNTQKKIEKTQKLQEIIDNKGFLYFKDTFGGGIIQCHGCGYKEEINCSTHGFGEPAEFYDGYQCQLCGKYHTITTYGNEITNLEKCECGGVLSRENPIFCPKCKVHDVSWQWTYMT